MYNSNAIQEYNDLLNLLRASIWENEYIPNENTDYKKLYLQCLAHTVIALPAKNLEYFTGIDEELKKKWKSDIYKVIYRYHEVIQIQSKIIQVLKDNNIRFVILKGSSASCYYINPSLRVMGDIDLMPCKEDYDKADSILTNLCMGDQANRKDSERHTEYVYRNTVIELHKRFASFNDPERTQYLDNLIMKNIMEDTKLSDDINGLVLLQHINQHLEIGIGLRQIIDWIYYVNSCLDDSNWDKHFYKRTRQLGLDTLAITITKICKDYLGLKTSITWCDKADNSVCRELLLYILESGNFGINKRTNAAAVSNTIIRYKNLFDMLIEFQKKGSRDWEKVKRHKALIPFAWLYESVQFVKLASRRKITGYSFMKGYLDSRSRRKLMLKVGAKDISMGTAKKINGELVNDKQRH